MKSIHMVAWIACLLFFLESASGQLPLDKDWQANSILKNARHFTIAGLGACQGVSIVHNKVYLYGDRYDLTPRIGVIQEFHYDATSSKLSPTGRVLKLNKQQQPLITHPTGIAYLDKNNVFLGDTVNQKARIYLIDWQRAWQDGNLDHAVKHQIEDDLAVNGCRPITIQTAGQRMIATADYGSTKNEIRFYDPAKLSTASKTSDPKVLKTKFDCGPFNQNLDWDAETGQLICIQNVVPGRGWRLQFIDLEQAFKTKKGAVQPALTKEITFPAHTELEGSRFLPDGKLILTTAHRENNVWIGTPESIVPKMSKRGHAVPFFDQ